MDGFIVIEELLVVIIIALKFVFKIVGAGLMEVLSLLVQLGQLVKQGVLHFPDWYVYWVQWVAIAYSLFILAYNLVLKLLRPFRGLLKLMLTKKDKKSKKKKKHFPRSRARHLWNVVMAILKFLFKWLRVQRLALAFFVGRRLPRMLLLLGRRGAKALWHYAKLAWCWCCWCWGSIVDYRRRAARALWVFWGTLDQEAWDTFREIRLEGPLLQCLVLIAREFFYRLKAAIWRHGVFLVESFRAFLSRPFTQKWTVFRFFKHLLGITFGITFFYYGFLWCAYIAYFCCDFFFLFIELVFLKVLQPLFFPLDPSRDAFLKVYDSVVEPLRSLIMDDLFTHLPKRIKVLKDRIFPEAWFLRRVLEPGLWHLVNVLLPRWGWQFYRFVTITAYYQTRYFIYQLKRPFIYIWVRRYRYRRRLARLSPRTLYRGGKGLLMSMTKRIWWIKMRFHLRDMWRWFSFVWRRYLLLPHWRRLQYRWKRRRLRFLFKLRCWAVWLGLLWPLLFWGGLIGALLSLAFFFFL